MKKKKIVIIRGIVTAGKTTTSYELAKVLPGWMFIDVWKIKEMFEPLGFKTTEERVPTRTISKKVMMTMVREVIKELGVNIILQESSRSFTKKSLKEILKKHNYKVYSFFLDLNEKDVDKRDRQREKPTMGLVRQVKKGNFRKLRHAKVEKGDIVINTSKHSIKQVVDIILKEIGEKRRKHPNAHALRKSW